MMTTAELETADVETPAADLDQQHVGAEVPDHENSAANPTGNEHDHRYSEE